MSITFYFTMSHLLTDLLQTKALHSKDPIDRYICEHSLRYTSEQQELLDDIKNVPAVIQPWLGSTDEAQFFQVLIKLMNAKRASNYIFIFVVFDLLNNSS